MTRIIPIFSCLAALLVLGCSSPKDDPQCDAEVTLTVSSAVPPEVLNALVVQGSAVVTRNISIRSISVAGVEATLSSFNFRTWTATVPFETLLALNTTADVEVPIDAVLACGDPVRTTLKVHLNRHPEIAVSTLTITPAFPAKPQYLPANGSASAVLTLTGNPQARGATATLRATGEGHFSGAGSSLPVVLAGDGTSAAMATALVTGDGEGSIFLTATALNASANFLKIDTAAAPKIFPPSAKLITGQSLVVLVEKRLSAQTVTCSVQTEKGLTVTPASDMSSFTLVVADTLSSTVQAVIECHDDYGQTTRATYSAAPPAP